MKIYGMDELMARQQEDLELINSADTRIEKLTASSKEFFEAHIEYLNICDDIRVIRVGEKAARTRENARMQYTRAVERNIREGILPDDFTLEPIRRKQADDHEIIDNCDKQAAALEQNRKHLESAHYEYCDLAQRVRTLQMEVRDAKARQQLREQFWRLMERMGRHGVRAQYEN